MGRKLRIALALFFFVGITLLFLDFTGTVHAWLGWMAKVQFLPAVLALHVVIVVALLLLTWVLGRVYCSVVCPLGVMQDVFARMGRWRKKNRYAYSPALSWLRYGMLAVFVATLLAGVVSFSALLAPYSAYGRIASSLFAPLWAWGNNLLAYWAERADSYAFYSTEVWLKGASTLGVAVLTLGVLGVLAWRNGRTYCNTICPVGTVLGLVARHSLFRPVVDTSKCNGCGLCARRCKAACIDSKNHRIDYSRCVVCLDCLDTCRQGAIRYERRRKAVPMNIKEEEMKKTAAEKPQTPPADAGRRSFLTGLGLVAAGAALRGQEKKVDGGLAVIEDKKIPERATRIVPPGAKSLRHFAQHCTACQLCVSVCPNGVLRPSGALPTLMQPESSYERGYCRPECVKCSEVCPAGAIGPITVEEKSAIQIGHAVWIKKNCVPLTDGVECGNCARHCPTGAITMVASDPKNADSPKIPAINTERCIGCGACENLCPARPFSAIYVEGHERQRVI